MRKLCQKSGCLTKWSDGLGESHAQREGFCSYECATFEHGIVRCRLISSGEYRCECGICDYNVIRPNRVSAAWAALWHNNHYRERGDCQ